MSKPKLPTKRRNGNKPTPAQQAAARDKCTAAVERHVLQATIHELADAVSLETVTGACIRAAERTHTTPERALRALVQVFEAGAPQ